MLKEAGARIRKFNCDFYLVRRGEGTGSGKELYFWGDMAVFLFINVLDTIVATRSSW